MFGFLKKILGLPSNEEKVQAEKAAAAPYKIETVPEVVAEPAAKEPKKKSAPKKAAPKKKSAPKKAAPAKRGPKPKAK